MPVIALRPLTDGDLDALFHWESDPTAVNMAAFTRADPSDRAAFDAHYARIRANPVNTLCAIEHDGAFVGTISSFPMMGERTVAYWIDPARWGEGLASAALLAFLEVETTRPLCARVAEHNAGSRAVLQRAGFAQTGTDSGYADGLGRDVVEHLFELPAPSVA